MSIKEIDTVKDFYHSSLFSLWLQTHKNTDIHPCFQCPEIKEDFEWRIDISDEPCRYEKMEDFLDDIREICDCCWCLKYVGKTWMVLHAKHCDKYKEE